MNVELAMLGLVGFVLGITALTLFIKIIQKKEVHRS